MRDIITKFKLPDVCFNLFYSMLTGIFTIFALSFLGFIFHISINVVYPVLGILVSFITLFILEKKNSFSYKHIFYSSVLLAIIYVTSIILAGHFVDYTGDGRFYHQLSALLLGNGWNPVYETASSFSDKCFNMIEHTGNIITIDFDLIWVQSYTKFSEILAANFFILTKHFECGKTINFLSAFMLFGYAFYILNKDIFSKIHPLLKFIISTLFLLNPIIFNELVTYCNDGLVCTYFLFILFGIIDIETNNKQNIVPWSIIAMSSVILINIKFGGFLYSLATLLIYSVYLLIFKQRQKLLSVGLLSLFIVVLGLLSGINPYYTNIKQNNSILYAVLGKDRREVVNSVSTKHFDNKSTLYKYFLSTFSATEYLDRGSKAKPRLKPPFWIYKFELNKMHPQENIGGFGVFWSGILLLSLILAPFIRYKSKEEKYLAILIFTIIIMLVLLNPYCWWARHSSHQWIFPVFVSMFAINNSNLKQLAYLIILFMLANSVIFTIYSQILERHYRKDVNNTYNKLENKKIKIYGSFEATISQKLKERNIQFEFVTQEYYNKHKTDFKTMPCTMLDMQWSIDD